MKVTPASAPQIMTLPASDTAAPDRGVGILLPPAPIEAGVEPRDSTILWSADGEVSAKPDDQIRGKLGLDPAHPAETLEATKSLVLGILNHARAFAGA